MYKKKITYMSMAYPFNSFLNPDADRCSYWKLAQVLGLEELYSKACDSFGYPAGPSTSLFDWKDVAQIYSKIYGCEIADISSKITSDDKLLLYDHSKKQVDIERLLNFDRDVAIISEEIDFKHYVNNRDMNRELYDQLLDKYEIVDDLAIRHLKEHTSGKTLLILGNGANLEMGYPTKWFDYWDERIDVLWPSVQKLVENDLNSFLFNGHNDLFNTRLDDLSDILPSMLDSFEKNNSINAEIEINKISSKYVKNYLIMMVGLCSDRSYTNISFFDYLFSGLYFFGNSDIKSDNWADVEACISQLLNDFDINGEKKALGIVGHSSNVSPAIKFVSNLVYSSKFSSFDECDLIRDISRFEDTFGAYLKKVTFLTIDEKNQYLNFIRELIDYKPIEEHSNHFDILDFNYEPLSDFCKISDLDFIIQPHGNLLSHILIGGNEYGKRLLSNNKLSKFNRNGFKKYLIDNNLNKSIDVSGFEKEYVIDLRKYSTVIIYGWSFNDIDMELFRIEQLYGFENTIPDNYADNDHDIQFVILTNDKFKLSPKDKTKAYLHKLRGLQFYGKFHIKSPTTYKSYTDF